MIFKRAQRALKIQRSPASATKAVPFCNACLPTNLYLLPTNLVVHHQVSPMQQKLPTKFCNPVSILRTAQSFTINSKVSFHTHAARYQFSVWKPLNRPKSWPFLIHWIRKYLKIILNIHWPHSYTMPWKKVPAPNSHHVWLPWTMPQRMPVKWLINLRSHSIELDKPLSHVNWLKLFPVLLLWIKYVHPYF